MTAVYGTRYLRNNPASSARQRERTGKSLSRGYLPAVQQYVVAPCPMSFVLESTALNALLILAQALLTGTHVASINVLQAVLGYSYLVSVPKV